MRVIGYARLSSASDESTSIARQHEIIKKHAEVKGWSLTRTVQDDGVSATKQRLNRPGVTQVREAIASGEAEAVVVWRLDRIARNVVDFGTLLDEGVSIVSATEPIDTTTPTGRAMAEILQVFAAMEAASTSARVRDSVDYLRRNDRFPGGRLPYGYRPVPHPSGTGRALDIAPEEGVIVREAAERVLDRESVYKVAADFTERGIPTRSGAPGWSVHVLTGVLTGGAVLGRVVTRGEVVRDAHGIPREVWSAILTVDESAQIGALLGPKRQVGIRRKASRLLSGLLYCVGCDRPLVVQRYRTPRIVKGREVFAKTIYRCGSGGTSTACSARVSIGAQRCDEFIVGEFLAAVGHLPVIEEVVTATEPVGLASVEEAIQETARALAVPGADLPGLAERMTALHARREHIAALPTEPVSTMIETGRTFAEEWEARDGMEARRQLLLSGIDHIVVGPSTIGKQWDPTRLLIRWKS